MAVVLVIGLSGCANRPAPPSATELVIIPGTSSTTESSSVAPLAASSAAASSATAPSGAIPGKPKGQAANITSLVQQVAKATVAAVVVDRQTGATLISENADRTFDSGSLVKVLIALDALRSHPHDSSVASRVTTMIRYSDDDLASSFWVSEGGTSIVTRMGRVMGLQSIKPPNPPGEWGWTRLTANDMIRTYDYLMNKAPDGDRQTVLAAMASAAARGSDGFDQRFGIPHALGGSYPWAIKQAWATDDSTRSLHTSGFVGDNWRYEVVVMTEYSLGTSWSTGVSAIDTGTRGVATVLS